MKRFWIGCITVMIAVAVTWVAVSKYQSIRFSNELKEREAAWLHEKDLLESALSEAQAKTSGARKNTTRTEIVEVIKKQSPAEIIALLKTLRIGPGQTQHGLPDAGHRARFRVDP